MVDTLQQQRDNARDKIRASIKQQRKALGHSALHKAQEGLFLNCKHLLDGIKSIAGYQAMGGEISLEPIFTYCHQNNITTLLPIMRNKALMFAPFNATTTFSIKQYGIQEPDVPETQWVTPEDLELVLVPLVAFDNTCNRIGMGGGFYDRSFAFRKLSAAPPALVGVAHQFQQVDDVYTQPWDVGLDCIASDEAIIRPSNV